ncbi:DUF2793 domain-containing protein [uncultured Enterovirga sp.]|uniref:DUF2793 domain-containing protein n=1 Tax=uncultured Enterovirga sp. TaxID=2026352 RepID=UPI0035CB3CF2
MQDTPNLALPLIAAAQAQKHVTHNEGLLAIDALLQCAVADKDLTVPPGSPVAGQRYIVPSGATGAWSGKATLIACWQQGFGWRYFAPKPGFMAFVLDESLLYVFDGAAWTSLTSALAAIQNLGRLCIGTTADATNPFAAKLNKALWTARSVAEGGDGDLRYTLNKEAASDIVSLLFQTGFSGRLELGLIGSDNLSVKVSPDGTTWRTALSLDAGTGSLDFTSPFTTVASAATTDIGSLPSRKILVTGTTAITSFGSAASKERILVFTGALTLTHNATTLILPGAANITTAANDVAHAVSDAAGSWRIAAYARASGKSVVAGSATEVGLGPTVTPSFGGLVLNSAGPFLTFAASAAPATMGMSISVGGTSRWFHFFSDGTGETGSNAGSNYTLSRYSDAGVYLGPGFSVMRASGNATFHGTVFTPTGTVTTSDARLKTEVQPFDAPRIAAARDLAAAIGSFKFLSSIAEKGEAAARTHTGLTVQRAMRILAAHGLDPVAEAFICYDEWEACAELPPLEARAAVIAEDGSETEPATDGRPGIPARPAGSEYRFRTDQLALFIARGQEAALAGIEARLAAIEARLAA